MGWAAAADNGVCLQCAAAVTDETKTANSIIIARDSNGDGDGGYLETEAEDGADYDKLDAISDRCQFIENKVD